MTDPMKAAAASIGVIAGSLAMSSMAWGERASSRVITCEGPFGRHASHSDLVKAFRTNVVYREIDGAGLVIAPAFVDPHASACRSPRSKR